MAKHTLSVTDGSGDNTHMPDWSAQYLIFMNVLRERGWLDGIADWLRVARQGGYVGLDIFAFLLAMFCWPRPDRRTRAIHAFSDACCFFRGGLAAAAGRRSWPMQSAVSRFLAVVPAGSMLLEAGAQLLRLGIAKLACHPDAQSRDTFGKSWHVFDFDPTVLAIRQRALPEDDDAPPASRRVAQIAAPGYAGRKRGEVQVSIGALQHAGTGLWLQTMLQAGSAKVSVMLGAMLGCIQPWLAEAGATMERALVRADGAAGNIPSLNTFAEHGVHYVTRLAWYGLLDRQDVRTLLADAQWLAVPDSGSGPRRQAAELGRWPWRGALPADAPQGMESTRLVVTRFAADKKHGAGHVANGWQYELFGMSIDPSAWPAPEAAELYYGRCGQENRFGQLMAELGIDKLFSTALGGHWLVVLVGLFTWNLRTILGAQRVGDLPPSAVEPEPRKEIVAQAGRETEAAEMQIPEPKEDPIVLPEQPMVPTVPPPPATIMPPQKPVDRQDILLTRLGQLNWSAVQARQPGWKWQPEQGLLCPAGIAALPYKLRSKDGGSPSIIFRTREHDCCGCPQRTGCFGGNRPQRWQRDVAVSVAGLGLSKADISRRPVKKAMQRVPLPDQADIPVWRPPTPTQAGPWTAQPPRLVPSVFRAGLIAALLGATARLQLQGDQLPAREPPHQANTPAKRQHRRQTWTQRLARNALAATARVDVWVTARDPWLIRAGGSR